MVGFRWETNEVVEGYRIRCLAVRFFEDRIRCLAVRFFEDRMRNRIEDPLGSSQATLDYSIDPMRRWSQDLGIWKQSCLVVESLVAY